MRDAATLSALAREARAWLRTMKSGRARAADAQALVRWCAQSPDHAQAFRDAQRTWQDLLPAAALAGMDDYALARLRKTAPAPAAASRRAFLGGAAAFAAVAGVALMWPTLGEPWQSDYRTATGERRTLDLAEGVRVELNTRSSIAMRAAGGIDLIKGEVAVDIAGSAVAFTVGAAGGTTSGVGARFALRYLDDEVCVTCVAGTVEVAAAGRTVTLAPGEQVVYDRQALRPVTQVALADVSAWRDGFLSFQQATLAHVVAEINRYRPGRVVLLADRLQDRPVSGRFKLADLDQAIGQIQRLFHLEVTSLPGGVIILK